jgi:hypothetical protein
MTLMGRRTGEIDHCRNEESADFFRMNELHVARNESDTLPSG